MKLPLTHSRCCQAQRKANEVELTTRFPWNLGNCPLVTGRNCDCAGSGCQFKSYLYRPPPLHLHNPRHQQSSASLRPTRAAASRSPKHPIQLLQSRASPHPPIFKMKYSVALVAAGASLAIAQQDISSLPPCGVSPALTRDASIYAPPWHCLLTLDFLSGNMHQQHARHWPLVRLPAR